MYINHVTEERAEDILEEILSSIRYDEDWNDSFLSVSDYESFSPKDIEDAIAHPNALYNDEHAFASVTISYSVLHDRMKQIIETIIDKNAQCTNKSTTSQGIGFARALALYNIVYVRLYADLFIH